jgi:uncharacterized protein (TIGR03435 family)
MKTMLRTVRIFAIAALLVSAVHAQNAPMDITGNFQGTLQASKELRIVLKIAKRDNGSADRGIWHGVFYSIDDAMGSVGRDTSITLNGPALSFAVASIDGSYEGKLSADGESIAGTWIQGNQSHPLKLVRTTPENTWAIPNPDKFMTPDANPEFEVATIKPSDPNAKRTGFHFNGRHVSMTNETLNNLISLAYGVHQEQIVNGPSWFGTDRYDIDGVSDLIGQPNFKQMQGMYQKLLASRFKLTFHREKKELSVYALTVGKSGPKLIKSLGDPNGQPDQNGNQNAMKFTNTSMSDLALMLQFSLDRPVLDQTNLAGRFDFLLKWTPSEAQVNDPAAPPGLFTAIQQQLGLKLEPVKAPDDVIVIDNVEKPSAN